MFHGWRRKEGGGRREEGEPVAPLAQVCDLLPPAIPRTPRNGLPVDPPAEKGGKVSLFIRESAE